MKSNSNARNAKMGNVSILFNQRSLWSDISGVRRCNLHLYLQDRKLGYVEKSCGTFKESSKTILELSIDFDK